MGNLATPEALLSRWNDVLRDPALRDLPYKIELNAWGKVEMSPASNRHGRLQAELAYGEITPYLRAPDICIESLSESNVQAEIDAKRSAFFAAGATEVWLVAEEGSIRYFDRNGEKEASGFPVKLSLPPPMKGNR